jgi:hypothetical protein
LKAKRRHRLRIDCFVLYVFALLVGIIAVDFVQSRWVHRWQSALLLTGGFFGVLFYSFWGSLRRASFLKGFVIMLPVHGLMLWALMSINPLLNIAKLAAVAYGGLIGLVYAEWVVAAQIIEVFERRSQLHANTTQAE